MCNRVRLGTVRAPSGILVVIDAGYAGLWCRTTKDFDDDSDWPVSDKDCRAIKNSVDIRVIGANAADAGKTFDRQWHRLRRDGIPRDGLLKCNECSRTPLPIRASGLARRQSPARITS